MSHTNYIKSFFRNLVEVKLLNWNFFSQLLVIVNRVWVDDKQLQMRGLIYYSRMICFDSTRIDRIYDYINHWKTCWCANLIKQSSIYAAIDLNATKLLHISFTSDSHYWDSSRRRVTFFLVKSTNRQKKISTFDWIRGTLYVHYF